jgi:uncharacterized protein YbaA (DUF1428 family)
MVEYLMDAIEADPSEAYPRVKLNNGSEYRPTGDAVVDDWERALAAGETPDFSKAFTSDESRRVFEKWLRPKKKEELPEPAEEFSDNYTTEK